MSQENAYYRGIKLLAEGQITQAVQLQEPWLVKLHSGDLNDVRTSLLADNRLMLEYFLTGNGNASDDMRRSLTARAYLLLDRIYELMRLKTNSRHEFESLRNVSKQVKTLSAVSLDPYDVFDYFWLSRQPDSLQHERLCDLLQKSVLAAQAAVSGILLNLIRHFSKERILWLIEAFLIAEDEVIRQRVIVALTLVFLKYDKRLEVFPEITQAMESLMAADRSRQLMLFVISQAVMTLRVGEADEMVRSVQDSVFEALQNRQNNGEKVSPLIIIEEDEEQQPQWLQRIQNSLSDTINRMAELSEQGVDVNFSHFRIVHDLPFFASSEASWLLPFYQDNKRLNLDFSSRMGGMLLSTLEKRGLCDSDKYALCVMFSQMQNIKEISEQQWQLVAEQLDGWAETPLEADLAAKHYLQDLYRYFQLNKWNVPDELSAVIDSVPCSRLLELLSPSAAWLIEQADVYVRVGHYHQAIELYNKASLQLYDASEELDELGAQLYQKIGYAYEKAGDFGPALEAYNRADIFSVDQRWTLWHIVGCEMKLGHYQRALEHIDRMCRLYPATRRYVLTRAAILEQMNDHAAAYQIYHELLEADADDVEVLRRLADSLLLDMQLDKALEYSSQIVAKEKFSQKDMLRHAWIELLGGRVSDAYTTFLRIADNSKQRLELFDSEAERLKGLIAQHLPQNQLSPQLPQPQLSQHLPQNQLPQQLSQNQLSLFRDALATID